MKKLILLMLISIFGVTVFAQSDAKTKIDANLMFAKNQIQRSIDDPKNSVPDDVMKLLYQPEVWKAELAVIIKEPVSAFPANWLAPIQDKINELKGLLENGWKDRSWKQPPFSRPVEEGMAKAKFLSYYKGASVLKIGSNYKDWNMFKNSLGIPTNKFIRGIALVKYPGQEFCIQQEWIVKQTYAGGKWSASKVDSFGGGGVLMKCN